ncbi:serine-threonine kinase receptor-associated protein [Drosophila elegans]|uniref:serine-threonine kinase receptor-associated protein n=1 Tax=Drosophila elegans TaxID=30023 RepID=UPI0007E7176D|nr:serine-threonine kinase receptor-associated protein [Drosophila elegans]
MSLPDMGGIGEGHADAVVDLAFSRDLGSGFVMASAGLDGQVMLRNGYTASWIGSLRRQGMSVWSVALGEDGKILASGGGDCTARVWDVLLGRQLAKIPHPETVASVDLNRQANRLVTGCLGPAPLVTLFDLQCLDKTPLMVFGGHHRGVRDLTFCLDNRCVLTSSYDRTVKMWDCLSGESARSIVLPHHAKALELHHGGDMVTIAYGRSLIFLDCKQFEVLKHRKMAYKVTAVTLHPSRESYVCGNSLGYVYKYDYSTDALLLSYFYDNGSEISFLKFSPDGEVCAIGTTNGSIVMWLQNMDKWNIYGSSDEDYEKEEEESTS